MPSIQLDPYLIDSLMPDLIGHDRRPSAFVVYLLLTRRSARTDGRVQLSLRDIADATGLSKRASQEALRLLERRKLIRTWMSHQTAIPEYEILTPWLRRSAHR